MAQFYEQIITMDDVNTLVDATNDLTDKIINQTQFDELYEISVIFINQVHYNQLFNKEDGTFNNNVSEGDKVIYQKLFKYAVAKQINEFTFYDFFNYNFKDDVEGASAEIEAYEPKDLYSAFGLTIRELLLSTSFYLFCIDNDERMLFIDDPERYLLKAAWEAWLISDFEPIEEKVKNLEEQIENILAGSSNTKLVIVDDPSTESTSGLASTQQGANREFALKNTEQDQRLGAIEDFIDMRLTTIGRTTNGIYTLIEAGLPYPVPFQNFVNNDGEISEVSDYFETTDFVNFSLKEGIIIESGTRISIPYELAFGLTAVSLADSAQLDLVYSVNGAEHVASVQTINIRLGQDLSIINGTAHITTGEEITSLTFRLQVSASNGTFNASILLQSKMYFELNSLKGVPTDLDSYIMNIAFPVGSLKLSTTAPIYGTWEDLGILAEGQAIIGGTTSNGEVSEHRHRIFNSDTGSESINNFPNRNASYRFGVGDDAYIIVGTDKKPTAGVSSNGETTTGTTLGTANKAYGLGVGLDMHIWKRTA